MNYTQGWVLIASILVSLWAIGDWSESKSAVRGAFDCSNPLPPPNNAAPRAALSTPAFPRGPAPLHIENQTVIKPDHFRDEVIIPTLARLPGIRNDEHVHKLLLGTAAQESKMGLYLRQLGGGPGLGVYQIEPKTHHSIWDHYLAYRPDLAEAVRDIASQGFMDSEERFHAELVTNLAYATAIARLKYLPVKEKIPNTIEGMARYWDQYYNANDTHGTEDEFKDNYKRYIAGAI